MLLSGALVWPRVAWPEHPRSTHFGVAMPLVFETRGFHPRLITLRPQVVQFAEDF